MLISRDADTRFFVLKSFNNENLDKAMDDVSFATPLSWISHQCFRGLRILAGNLGHPNVQRRKIHQGLRDVQKCHLLLLCEQEQGFSGLCKFCTSHGFAVSSGLL